MFKVISYTRLVIHARGKNRLKMGYPVIQVFYFLKKLKKSM